MISIEVWFVDKIQFWEIQSFQSKTAVTCKPSDTVHECGSMKLVFIFARKGRNIEKAQCGHGISTSRSGQQNLSNFLLSFFRSLSHLPHIWQVRLAAV